MSDIKNPLVSEEEIEKALKILGGLHSEEVIEKSTASTAIDDTNDLDEQIAELQRQKEARLLQKSSETNIGGGKEVDYDALVKSINNELGSKFEAFANISKSLMTSYQELSQNDEFLKEQNSSLLKSVEELTEKLSTLSKSVEEIAESPVNKIGAFKRVSALEKFEKSVDNNGKETLSLVRDKRKVLNALSKSLDTEEGQRRLGDVVGCIENSFIDQQNASFILKAVTNEIGGDFNITL